jgi:hypothetical protein
LAGDLKSARLSLQRTPYDLEIIMSSKVLSGGDKIQKALADIAKRMGGGEVSIGFMAGATYPDGTPVAAVAFWNEYGKPETGQPPRPFFRRMISDQSPGWADKMARAAKATDYDGPKVLALMGEDIRGALVQSINDFQSPALAASTIKAKGFSKPLISSGHMRDSVTYVVSE